MHDIKFPVPFLFTGKRDSLPRWKTSIRLYLEAHDVANLTDNFQVLFALSRVMDEGPAGVWKENWINSHQQNYGNLIQFFADITAAFVATTSVQEAMRKLKNLKMGGNSVDEHTAQFELLVDQAGLATAGDPILIDYYRTSLASWLVERIYQGDVPTTLVNWKARAILLDHNKRLAASFTGGGRPSGSGYQGNKKKKFTFRRYPQQSSNQKKDDDAMDVDRLAVEIQRLSFKEQKDLMEKGLCFGCRKPGHFVANCPMKKTGNSPKAKRNNGYKGKGKPNARSTMMNIRALVSELSEGEMEEFQEMAETEGFGFGEEEGQDF